MSWGGKGHGLSSCSFEASFLKTSYLSQHGVRQLADLLHVLSADAQFAATDPQERSIGQLLAVQLHLDEVVLPGAGVLDAHLQHQLWKERERDQNNEAAPLWALVLCPEEESLAFRIIKLSVKGNLRDATTTGCHC